MQVRNHNFIPVKLFVLTKINERELEFQVKAPHPALISSKRILGYRGNRRHLRPFHIPTPPIPQVRIVPDQNITRPVPPPKNILPPSQSKTPPKPMPRTLKQPPLPQSTPRAYETNIEKLCKFDLILYLLSSQNPKAQTPRVVSSDTKSPYATRSGRVI